MTLSSSDDDTGESVGLSDLSITLLCDTDEVLTPVNSDQVLSDVDLPIESVSHDKRQVIRMFRLWMLLKSVGLGIAQRPVSSVASGKRMPGKVSMAISRAPLSLDMTVTCTSSVAPTSAHPPAVTSIPAMSMATITSGVIDHRMSPRFQGWNQYPFRWGRVCQPLSSLHRRCLSYRILFRGGECASRRFTFFPVVPFFFSDVSVG